MTDRADDLVLALRDLGDWFDASPSGSHELVTGAIERIRAEQLATGQAGGPPEPSPRWGRRRGSRLARARPRGRADGAHGRRHWVLVAAAAVVVVLAGVLAAPGPRRAVARWMSIGRVTVNYADDVPTAAGRDYDLGTPVPLARAIARADWPLAAPPAAGDPAQAYVDRPAGSVTLVWPPSSSLPEVDDSGIGLLLGAIPGTVEAGLVSKRAGPGTTVALVRVDDQPAYWISGEPHEVLVVAPDGRLVPDATRLAGNTLVWTDGDVTYRLESALDSNDAIELASSLRPLAGS
jgi:hypothetical protein